MSSKIDEKIVEMRFDNKQFESGVDQSMKSLKNLNDSVSNMSDSATKGFDNLDKSASKLNLAGLTDAVGVVGERFSVMETIAIGALMRIGQQAVDAGERLVKSITVEPIKQGFDEYELKMQSVQTIMASTGEEIGVVNSYLEELNTYSDKTIYSFSDMTNNIGKFTNNGVKLDDAVKAIQGISNEAALAGANTQEASRAMYNFSQALSQGSVKLIDWKSIENANMATQAFKQNLLDTALAMGTVKKEGDKYVSVTTDANGKVSAAFDSVQNFNDSLSSQWMTTEVLVQTLQNYSTDIREMTEAEKAEYEEKLRGIGYTEEQIKAVEELGVKAFDAAQDVKTFSQLVDTMKEAVGSGWSQTFELLFGDLEEAKKLWTGVNNVVGGMIDSSSKARNQMLTRWDDLGGRTMMIKALGNVFTNLINIMDAVKSAFRDLFPPMTGDQLARITKNFLEFTEHIKLSDEQLEKVHRAVQGFLSPLRLVKDLIVAVINGFKPLFKGVSEAGGGFLTAAANIGDFIDNVRIAIEKMGIFDVVTEKVTMVAEAVSNFVHNVTTSIKRFAHGIDGVFLTVADIIADGITLILDSISALTGVDLTSLSQKIRYPLQVIGDTIDTVSGYIAAGIGGIVETLKNFVIAVRDGFQNSNLPDIFDSIGEKVTNMFDKITSVFDGFKDVSMDGIDSFKEKVEIRFDPIEGIFNAIAKVFEWFGKVLKIVAPLFKKLGTVLGKALGKIGSAVGDFLADGNYEKLFDLLNGGILALIGVKLGQLISSISGVFDGVSDVIENASSFTKNISTILDGVRGCLEAYQQNIKAKTLLTIAEAVAILAAALFVISLIDGDKLASSLGAITAEFYVLMRSMKSLTGYLKDMGKDSGSLVGAGITMIALSGAILILSSAVKKISEIDTEGVVKGVSAIGVICFILSKTMKSFGETLNDNDVTGIMKTMLSLIPLAIAINLLADAVAEFGSLSVEQLIKGGATLIIVLKALENFVNSVSGATKMVSIGIGMTALAAAMLIFGEAIENIGNLNISTIIKGLATILIVLGSLNGFINDTSGAKKMLSISVGMTALAAAMLIFGEAIENIGSLNVATIIKGLTTILFVLAALDVFIEDTKGSDKMISAAVGIIGISAAMLIMSEALEKIGSLSLAQLAKGLIGVGAAMAIMVVALNAMPGGASVLATATALLIMSTAILMLAPALKILGSMKLSEIGKGLLAIIAAFAALGISALILTPIAPIILILAGALALLGAACLMCGEGVLLLSLGLTGLAAAGSAGLAILITAIQSILALIPVVVKRLGQGFVQFVKLIGDNAVTIAEAVGKILEALLQLLIDYGPKLIETVITLIADLLKSLAKHMPEFIDAGMEMVESIIEGIDEHIDDLIADLVSLISDAVTALGEQAPKLIDAGIDLILNLIEGLGQGIEDHAEEFRQTILSFLNHLWEAILKFFGIHSPSTKMMEVGWNLIKGLAQGIWDMLKWIIGEIGKFIGKLLSKFGEILGKIFDVGKDIIKWLVDGIKEIAGDVWDAIKGAITAVGDKIVEIGATVLEWGKKVIGWIVDGVKEIAGDVWDAVKGAFTAITDKIGDIWETVKGWGKKVVGWICDGVKALVTDPWNAVKDALTLIGDKIVGFGATLVGYGKKIFSHIKEGFDEIKGYLGGTIEDELKAAYQVINGPHGMGEELRQAMKKLGGDMNEGLAKGMEDSMNTVNKQIDNTSSSIVERMKSKDNLNINSPSKVFAAIGASIDEGLAKGIDDYSYYALNSIDGLSTDTISAFDDISNAIENIASDNVAYMPTVRPVLDSTNLVGSLADISSINPQAALNLTADLNYNIGDEIASGMRDLVTNNNRMVETLNGVRNDLDELYSVVGNLKVVMDTGALVGQIATPIDYALGRNVRLSGRGV